MSHNQTQIDTQAFSRPSLVWVFIGYIRILLFSFVYMLGVWLFCAPGGTLFYVLTILWAVVFVVLWLGYFPVRYFKHRYRLDPSHLLVVDGVIYTRYNHIRRDLVQLVGVSRSPLGQLFGVANLVVQTAGSRTVVYGIPSDRAVFLCSLLCPKELPPAAEQPSQGERHD